MSLITLFYISNATLLLLHEIESAYEKEWEILKLPGGITGFLLFHIPIILVLFYGVIEIEKGSLIGAILGMIAGFSGLLPFLVHKIISPNKDHFNLMISNTLIYLNIVIGVVLLMMSARLIV